MGIGSRRASEQSEHVSAREDGVRVASRRAASGPLGEFGASERARGRGVCASGRLASRVGTSFHVVARQDVVSRRGSNANPHAKGRRFAPRIEREPHIRAQNNARDGARRDAAEVLRPLPERLADARDRARDPADRLEARGPTVASVRRFVVRARGARGDNLGGSAGASHGEAPASSFHGADGRGRARWDEHGTRGATRIVRGGGRGGFAGGRRLRARAAHAGYAVQRCHESVRSVVGGHAADEIPAASSSGAWCGQAIAEASALERRMA